MKRNISIFATIILVAGLVVPTGAEAMARYVDNFATTASTSAGINAGWVAGGALGRGLSPMIEAHAGKILVAGVLAAVIYYIYSKQENSQKTVRTQVRSCTKKGCTCHK